MDDRWNEALVALLGLLFVECCVFYAFGSLFVFFGIGIGSGRGVGAAVESLWEIVVIKGLPGVVWGLIVAKLPESVICGKSAPLSFRPAIHTLVITCMPFTVVANS